ncbi:thermonuclease family protein [Sinorhizobium sp. 7-81]|uniref:thermonuclease family protein n=1 Tax=Sinorhizobium sp. 8-89 TaxID=3049089 RepID=UPI0024C2C694|nr:thermonuclease family protein [Sinorhizobium sp. 8-89]MDK1492646.1 thermonuclease family protein [Sinorhizobium sp. 8-89]
MANSAQGAEPIVGQASVIDGDTIEIAGERIQFSGVDAPEGWQVCSDEKGSDFRCGKDAASALDAFLAASRPTRCDLVKRDRYGRFVGTCFRADGKDVNRWLVETGNAIDREEHSKGVYAEAQATARSAGAGIWRSQFGRSCPAPAGRVNRKPTCEGSKRNQ